MKWEVSCLSYAYQASGTARCRDILVAWRKPASNQRYGETRGRFDRTGSRNVEEISPVLGLEMRQYLRLVQIRASGERDDRQQVRTTGRR